MSDAMNTRAGYLLRREVEMDNWTAEAGPRAANPLGTPPNYLRTNFDFEFDRRNQPDSDASTEVPPEESHEKEAMAQTLEAREETLEQTPQNPADVPTEFESRSAGKKAVIMASLCMAVFLAALDVTIITTALPSISEHFHSGAGYTWVGSAYLLANAAATPLWGKVSDVFGRKPVLLMANVVFLVGSLTAALSNSIGMLIAARAVQGIGGGGLVTLVNICISDLFSLRSRGAYFGIIGGVWAVASSLGPIVGGVLSEKVSWRWCFYINLPLDGAAFLIILCFLDIKTPKTPVLAGLKAIDWLGSLLIVGGTLMFLFGLEFGGVSHPWSSPIVLCLLIFGVFTWGLFVLNEWKVAIYPVMPLRLFRSRNNCLALGCCFFHGMVFIAGSYYLPLYFQAVRGATPILSGVYILPTALSMSAGSIATGITIKKTGAYLPCIWAGFFMMTLGSGLFCDLYANSSWAKLILFQMVTAVGIGPLFQAPLIALQTHVKPGDIATATATFGFIRNLGTSIAVVIGGVVFQNQMLKKAPQLIAALGPQTGALLTGSGAGASVGIVDALPAAQRGVARTAFADSLHPMWIMFACISGAGLVLSLFLRKRQLSKDHTDTKTGLEAQKANREERLKEAAERAEKKKRRASGRPSGDLEHGFAQKDVNS